LRLIVRAVMRALMHFLSRLPLPALHFLGAALGWAVYGLSPTYRRNLRANLEGAGYREARTRRAAIAEAGKMALEAPKIWLRPRGETLPLVRELEGREHVEAALAARKGIVFLTPHMGCFEIAPQFAAEHFPITALYRAPKLQWVQALVEEGRAQHNVRLASADLAGVRELLTALARREAVGILPDQVPGEGEGEWAEFFGRPAYSMTLAARLASRPDTVCLVAIAERLPRGRGYAIHIRPAPEPIPGEPATRRVNRAIEEAVRTRPEQYLWGYNRYKTPRGAKPMTRANALS
jgi:KDO2-lipid IV(A) lauroyltransferase